MKSPREKYQNDPEYSHLVRVLESMIEQSRCTPSELMEACVLASINYEMRHIRERRIDPRTQDALRVLDRDNVEFSGPAPLNLNKIADCAGSAGVTDYAIS